EAAKLAKVQELRAAIAAFMRTPQKKDDKARAWEFGNCIAYIKNGLAAILEGAEYHRCGKNIRRHQASECRPQAQEAVRAAGLYSLYNELIDLIGECAVTDEMSCGVCRAEEGDDHHDSCPIGIIEEWAHNNLARESPPANAEAVD